MVWNTKVDDGFGVIDYKTTDLTGGYPCVEVEGEDRTEDNYRYSCHTSGFRFFRDDEIYLYVSITGRRSYTHTRHDKHSLFGDHFNFVRSYTHTLETTNILYLGTISILYKFESGFYLK